MRIYLSGTVAGNLKPYRQQVMKVYLASLRSEPRGRLAGCGGVFSQAFVLESFYYADETTEKMIPVFRDFMLDSGAFSFMTGKASVSDSALDSYLERYADFINRNKVGKFFELDVDSVFGYQRVLKLRKELERRVGRPCIPVWHRSRGKDEFFKMCDEYGYVAIGGIVSKEIKPEDYGMFPWFIREAHRRGAKIHGLGFTSLSGIYKYHFDSVDSTSWLSGNRFGVHYFFNGRGIDRYGQPKKTRLANQRATCVHNFCEWVKFQKYAETHL